MLDYSGPLREPVTISPICELVGSFGLAEVDLSEHIYSYDSEQ